MNLKTFTIILSSLSLSLTAFESCSNDDGCQLTATKSDI